MFFTRRQAIFITCYINDDVMLITDVFRNFVMNGIVYLELAFLNKLRMRRGRD